LNSSILNKIFSKRVRQQLVKYVLISLMGYGFVFVGLFILVDLLRMNEKISFMIIYAISYFFLYTLQLKFLFKKDHDFNKLIKFFFTILFFYICANLIYNLGLQLNLNYLLATGFTIVVLMPLRFMVSKLFVYKDID